jgi:demethylspheroidene O-methyltransferase
MKTTVAAPSFAADAPLRAPPRTPPPPFADRALAWRDRMVANPRFQRWAASFPLTRWIALRRSRRLFDLCAGFVYTQTLLAGVRLGLFDALAAAPATREALRDRLGLDDDGIDRLLGAARALELVEPRPGGRIGLGPLGAPLVGNAALAAMLEHNALLYDDLRDPVAVLRGTGPTRLGRYWGYGDGAELPTPPNEGGAAAYSALMTASQPLVAAEVLDAYDVCGHRRLLDIGGGEGAFLEAAAERVPHLELALFDLPAVAERARARLRAAGLAARATTHAGDFLRDPLPGGADLATLVRVLHDHPDDVARRLLRAAYDALEPGGTLIVAEPMSGVPGAETVGDAYFAFYLRAMGRGRTRTPAEYERMLREAGFRRVRVLPPRLPVQASVVVARK